jgi:hypothetical protein
LGKIPEIQKPIPEQAYLTDPTIHSETTTKIRRGWNVCRFSKISEIQKPILGRNASKQNRTDPNTHSEEEEDSESEEEAETSASAKSLRFRNQFRGEGNRTDPNNAFLKEEEHGRRGRIL